MESTLSAEFLLKLQRNLNGHPVNSFHYPEKSDWISTRRLGLVGKEVLILPVL
jgi:hypothetical protein